MAGVMNQPAPPSGPANGVYTAIPLQDEFAALVDAARYTSLPDAWCIGTSDVIGSTTAVAEGRYKTVNMIAAAVISAQINTHDGAVFPYIFGGDGAGFAVPPAWRDRAQEALTAVRSWAREEFGMELRVGMTRVADIRAAGHDVRVARFRAAREVDYAMFAGGGLSWAEAQMKAGRHGLPEAPPGTRPDLTGLSCRWSHMPSRHGSVLSLVILPREGSEAAFADLAREVIGMAGGLERSGHPVAEDGPPTRWATGAAGLEARARRHGGPTASLRFGIALQMVLAKLLVKTGLRPGGFDARHYRRTVGANADFRKFEDGLKMTLDCTPDTAERLRVMLDAAERDGIIRYGLHAQTEAMMTCIVPSVQSDDHVHFVDGAGGGYTAAAQSIKATDRDAL